MLRSVVSPQPSSGAQTSSMDATQHEWNGPAVCIRRATKTVVDQVRVRILIMKLSNPSSATCNHAKESARKGTRLS